MATFRVLAATTGTLGLVAPDTLTVLGFTRAGESGRPPRTGPRPGTDRVTRCWGGDFTGHFHIYGGGLDTNSATGFWGYHQKFTVPVHRDLPNGAVLCAEGWEHAGGGYELRGRACAEVHF
ncbi:hypothetical protein [Streptomyces sp. HD]|uniref:hypothetical protein n=1 Tax=Streptomyces sp. HD TaxID=3020892 RepID=UPI00232AEC3C|nr:hypothetical protein [Streptomyces sp. HD]MDC0773321.1 hypothetical protein [Streptomyces sp. HD]